MSERPAGIEVRPVEGIPEVRRGDDLAALIAEAAPDLREGDVVVVTQKVVSKAEGAMARIDPADPRGHKAIVEDQSVRVIRRRGDLVISETKHGFVCANAGVDLSNVDDGWAALLPLDGDRSARRIRDGIRASAGVEVAVADEVASAAELVMGKAKGIPAALVRGLDAAWLRDASVRELIRPPSDDLFR